MKFTRKSAESLLSAGLGFQASAGARLASQNIREIGARFRVKMAQQAKSPMGCRKGFAFEYLDALDQQLHLGSRYRVEVPDVTGKNSPDIRVRVRSSGKVVQDQQLKVNSQTAGRAANSQVYGKQEIRTPKGQAHQSTNPHVRESNVSAAEVSKGASNPNQAVRSYQFKAAIAEISHAAAVGAITGAVAALLISGLEHFLAVERGEVEIDQAIAAVFFDTLQGLVMGAGSVATFATIPAFFPALAPIFHIISVPLMAIGAFQLVNQVFQILDHHESVKRNALINQVYQQDAQFFESFDKQVSDYLGI